MKGTRMVAGVLAGPLIWLGLAAWVVLAALTLLAVSAPLEPITAANASRAVALPPLRVRLDMETANRMRFRADGGLTFLSFSFDLAGNMRVMDAASGVPLSGPEVGRCQDARQVALSQDGRRLACWTWPGQVIEWWDLGTGEKRVLSGVPNAAALALNPDGSLLAYVEWPTGEQRSRTYLWDAVANRWRELPLGEDGRAVNARPPLTFSPDGRLLAYGFYTFGELHSGVRLWDVTANALLADFLITGAWRVALSPGGELLAVESLGQVNLWDVQSRRQVAALASALAGDAGLAFSPDGALLAAGRPDGTVQLWAVP